MRRRWIPRRSATTAVTARPSGYAPLVSYASVQTVLVVVATAQRGEPSGRVLNLVTATVGLAALATGLVLRRPAPRAAWWSVAAGGFAVLGTAVGLIVAYGLGDIDRVTAVVPVSLGAASFPLLAVGLGLMGRLRVAGEADALDAAVLSVSAFLPLWAFYIGPLIDPTGARLAAAIAFPIGVLLVLTTAFKVVLCGGLHDPAVRLVLAAVAAFVVATVSVLVPALRTNVFNLQTPLEQGWLLLPVLLGAAGMHPHLAERRLRIAGDTGSFSGRRLALVVVLVLVVAVSLAGILGHNRDALGRSVAGIAATVTAASVLVLLLVARLALVAREADRRAASVIRAVAEQDQLQRELADRAMHDPLTGLANRAVLNERLAQVLKGDAPYALLLADLDGFKDINDTLGHQVGDDLLVQLSDRLVTEMPPTAVVARLGGDEFAVVLPETEEADARRRAATLLAAVTRPFEVGGREQLLTASIGLLVVGTGEQRPSPSDALRDVDLALYAAKGSGKNRVVAFEPGLRQQRLDHARVSNGLRHALSHDEMVMHYQPIVDLESSRIVAVEALLRWRTPGGRLVDSGSFISIAEETGLIAPIGAWGLRRACRDAKPWHDRFGVLVGVNVADRQLDDPDFVEIVLGALDEAGLNGSALVLELSEATLVATVTHEARRGKLRSLRARGVQLAVNDFGTGFTNLSYVSDLPVDVVKVDRAFTRMPGSPTASPAWALTRAVLQLIRGLDLRAIAEGVETAEQAQALRRLHVPLAQGYLLGRPMCPEDIDERLGKPAYHP